MDEELKKKIEEGNRFYADYIEGTKYILPQKHRDWLKFVSSCYKDVFNGKEVKFIIEILKQLKSNVDFTEIKNELNDVIYNEITYHKFMTAIVKFGENGPEFYEFACKNYSQKIKDSLEKQKMQNKEYEYQLIYGEPEEHSLCTEDD